jgi:hypothetical protein
MLINITATLFIKISIITLSLWIGLQSLLDIPNFPNLLKLPTGNINPTNQVINTSPKKNNQPETSIFLPANTPLMATLLTTPEDLAKLGKETISPQWSKDFQKIAPDLFAQLDINYQRQIQPWLGPEISFAITTPDLDRDPRNGQQLGWLLALTIDNTETSSDFVSRFWQERANQNIPINYQAYRGVQIISQNYLANQTNNIKNKSQPKYPQLSMALVGQKFLLIANQPEVLKSVIAQVESPMGNLPKTTNFQRAIAQTKNPLGFLWVNLADWVFSVGDQQVITWPQMAIALQEKDGNINTPILFFQENLSAQPALLDEPIPALQLIPANSTLVATSTNFSQLWQNITTLAANNSPFAGFLAPPIKQLQTAWGIDFTKDINPPLTGEYVLALLPNQTKNSPDWLFIVKDYPQIDQLLSHFDAIASQQGVSTGKFSLDNHQIKAWTQLNAEANKKTSKNSQKKQPKNSDNDQPLVTTNIKALHTSLNINENQYEIFANSLPALQKVWQVDDKTDFFHSQKFQQITNNLPTPNNGYLYIDWPANQTLFTSKLPALNLLVKSSKLIFPQLRSLSITNLASETGISENHIFWNYHPTKENRSS